MDSWTGKISSVVAFGWISIYQMISISLKCFCHVEILDYLCRTCPWQLTVPTNVRGMQYLDLVAWLCVRNPTRNNQGRRSNGRSRIMKNTAKFGWHLEWQCQHWGCEPRTCPRRPPLCAALRPTLSPQLASKQTLNTSFQQPAAHREGGVRWYFWWKHSFLRQTWQHNTLPSFLWHFNLPLSSQVAQRRSCYDLMLSSAFPT